MASPALTSPIQEKTPEAADEIFRAENLSVRFATPDGEVPAVTDLSLSVRTGETVAIVGESGSGKSQTWLAVMGLLAKNGRATGMALLEGQDLLAMRPRALDRLRGDAITMVFQDPMTALNPSLRISRQMTETLQTHRNYSRAQAEEEAIVMLGKVGIPDPERRFRMYPHALSGGMRQRVMIAMALLCRPKLLIADEPTTALDVTIQAQILDLFGAMKESFDTALILITHDLGVVAGLADRVIVMYAGRIVEEAQVDDLFADPRHPYTQALLASTPRIDAAIKDLQPIAGQPPNLQRLPSGCSFRPRCPLAIDLCAKNPPPLETVGLGRKCACFRASEDGL